MATYTFAIVHICPGGEHIDIQVYKDGIAADLLHVTDTEMANNNFQWRDVAPFLLQTAIQNAGAITMSEREAAIDAMQVIL